MLLSVKTSSVCCRESRTQLKKFEPVHVKQILQVKYDFLRHGYSSYTLNTNIVAAAGRPLYKVAARAAVTHLDTRFCSQLLQSCFLRGVICLENVCDNNHYSFFFKKKNWTINPWFCSFLYIFKTTQQSVVHKFVLQAFMSNHTQLTVDYIKLNTH